MQIRPCLGSLENMAATHTALSSRANHRPVDYTLIIRTQFGAMLDPKLTVDWGSALSIAAKIRRKVQISSTESINMWMFYQTCLDLVEVLQAYGIDFVSP